MSEFYDKVKKLHDGAFKELKQEYFDKAYAKIEETLGTKGRNEYTIDYFEWDDDDAVEKELIDLLKADGFKADFGDDGVVVTL
jgi:serine protease inhibitor